MQTKTHLSYYYEQERQCNRPASAGITISHGKILVLDSETMIAREKLELIVSGNVDTYLGEQLVRAVASAV